MCEDENVYPSHTDASIGNGLTVSLNIVAKICTYQALEQGLLEQLYPPELSATRKPILKTAHVTRRRKVQL